MASSLYRVSVLAFRMRDDVIDSTVIKLQHPHQKVVDSWEKKFDLGKDSTYLHDHEALQQHFNKNPETNVVRIHGTTHSCRETLLGEINTSLETLNHYENYDVGYKRKRQRLCNYSVHIEYFEENGSSLSEERIQLILKFAEKFLSIKIGSPFFVQRYKDSIILSYKNSDAIRHYTASFLLWLFRNAAIMQNCLENIEKLDSQRILWSYLSKEFLNNPSWGNSANPAIALSAFSYYCTLSAYTYIEFGMFTGPATFAQRAIAANYLMDWVENMVFKKFPEGVTYGESQLGNCTTEFQTFVNSTLGRFSSIVILKKVRDESEERIQDLMTKLEKALEKE